MARATVKVRILPARSVVIDDRAREAGDEVEVSRSDAKTLVDEGYAELASKPRRKATKKIQGPDKKRKPLTPKAIEDGEAERG